MKFIEQVKKDRATINSLKSKKEKGIFIWDYYKIPIISIIIVLTICITVITNALIKKPIVMYTVLLNSDSQLVEADESIFIEVLKKAGVDVENKEVDINDYLSLGISEDEKSDVETLQVLNALFSITDLDLFVSFKDQFDLFIDKDAFADLSLLIDKDILDKHQDDLYIYKNSNGEKIVGGIILHDNSLLHEAGYYHNDVVVGAVANGVNLENAIYFIKQLLID